MFDTIQWDSAEISSQRREQRCYAHQSCCQKIPSAHSLQHLRQFSVIYFVRARLHGGQAAHRGHEPEKCGTGRCDNDSCLNVRSHHHSSWLGTAAAIIIPSALIIPCACPPPSTHDGFGDGRYWHKHTKCDQRVRSLGRSSRTSRAAEAT